ncbi:MAG: S8 family serine peptidase [Planctomycetota bacterium]|nr:S8 family serine peptidase [Planctomycetota bacterium]
MSLRLPRSRWLLSVAMVALGLLPARADEGGPAPFPADGLLPKAEIGADRFLEAHPAYDGRGITVAIFDTGVDPGAPGLQTTSDGRPKIVDLVDGSGSGDVDTSVVRKAKDGTLEGLSGRTLKLGNLKAPSGDWHVGLKPAFELYPGGLVARLKSKRAEAFDQAQRAAIVALEREIEACRDATDGEPKRAREDLEERLRQLRALGDEREDLGPVFDCVVFNDGKVWRAVIDTDEDGDLGDEKALTNFRAEREWSTFGAEDRLNYGVNIYAEGRRLSIVADCGAHGTHVAGIVAAHYPDRPELNGIAPGAQIVAVKIGDTRGDSSSFGTGEERGVAAVLRNQCQLINMSYGGPTATPGVSRMEQLYSEVVNEHGVIFVASAGNEGPALSTVGAPGGTTSALFGVGAYVTPRMMAAQYALRGGPDAVHYTWSSRGPTADGALGVDFTAPGGAVAPVPNWSLQGSTQMNGTSMSAPNLCGGVALLLSGLKQEERAWTPARVRRALANTTAPIEGSDPFSHGHGLIQIPEAFAFLQAAPEGPEGDARYDVTLPGRAGARGLYLREPAETARVALERIQVKPEFRESDDHARRIGFSLRVALEATAPWIEVPGHLALDHGGTRFEVRVDPRTLEAGQAHFGWIHARDVDRPERGPVFSVPVTVVKPGAVDADSWRWSERLAMQAGTLERRFFAVPPGATWADLRLRTAAADAGRLLVVQAVQLLPGQTPKENEYEQYIRLDPNESSVHSFKVQGGRTLELVLAQYWSSLGSGVFEAELAFHGIQPSSELISLDGAAFMHTVDVAVAHGRERVSPQATLKTLRKTVSPSEFELVAGDPERDMLPKGRLVHEAVLTYPFKLAEDARVQPRAFLALYEDIYESWSSGLWMIFDEHKRLVGRGPIFDDATHALKAGDYVLRLHLRHPEAKRLEAVRAAPLHLDIRLAKPATVGIHATGAAVVSGGPGFSSREVAAGERVRLYLRPPARGSLGALAEAGDQLHGEIQFGEEVKGQFGLGRRPGGWPLRVLVGPQDPPAPKASGSADAAEDEKAKPDVAERVGEEILDYRVGRLAVLREAGEAKAFDALARALLAEHEGHVPVLVEQLRYVDREPSAKQSSKDRAAVVEAAARVIARIDRKRLAEHRGSGVKPETPGQKALHERMEARREALAEALHRQARALASSGETQRKAFIAAWRELEKWDDATDAKYLTTRVAYERARGRTGVALKIVREALEKSPASRASYEARLELLEALGWEHLAREEKSWLSIRFPPAYPPF